MPGLSLFAAAHETALLGLSLHNVAPPAPTTAPALHPNALGVRAVALEETCAWFSHTVGDRDSDWEALDCGEPCTTSGSLFGCEIVPTTCYDWKDAGCSATDYPKPFCCDENYPHCITAILDEDEGAFTAFRCGNGDLRGEESLWAEKTGETTSTSATTDGDERSTTTGAGTETATPDDNEADGGASDDSSSAEDSSNNDGNSDGGSSAPIGAIVGGVIGGIALIVGIAFALWFVRFQKKKQADKAAGNTQGPYEYDPAAGAYPGGYPPSQQGAYDYSAGGYNNGQYGMGSGSPNSAEKLQMQQTLAPVEMPADSTHAAPSELSSERTVCEKP